MKFLVYDMDITGFGVYGIVQLASERRHLCFHVFSDRHAICRMV